MRADRTFLFRFLIVATIAVVVYGAWWEKNATMEETNAPIDDSKSEFGVSEQHVFRFCFFSSSLLFSLVVF